MSRERLDALTIAGEHTSQELLDFCRENWDALSGDAGGWFDQCLVSYVYTMPWRAVEYGSHADAKRALSLAGSHFYDRAAVRSFNAKTSDPHMAGGMFWVESTKFEDDPRTYTVAYVTTHDNGQTLSIERLRKVDTLAEARKMRSTLARLVKAARES